MAAGGFDVSAGDMGSAPLAASADAVGGFDVLPDDVALRPSVAAGSTFGMLADGAISALARRSLGEIAGGFVALADDTTSAALWPSVAAGGAFCVSAEGITLVSIWLPA